MNKKCFPFSDNEMIYDINKHRYLLTESFTEEETGIALSSLNGAGMTNPSKRVLVFLNKVSDVIYRFIYNHSQNPNYLEFLLAKCPEYRDVIKKAMLAQVEYFRNNGDIANESGVNLKDGRVMDPVHLRGLMRISPDAYDILLNAGLLYTGKVVVPFGCAYREDY